MREIKFRALIDLGKFKAKGTFEIKWRQDGSPCWLIYPAWQDGQFWNISATHHTKGKQFIDVSGKVEQTNLEGYYNDGIEVIGNIYQENITS